MEPLRQSLGAVRASAPEFETGPRAAASDRYVCMRDGRSYQEKDVPMTTKGNEGQSALVTGASGGIGLELARVLAANLFSLVLLARSRDKLESRRAALTRGKSFTDVSISTLKLCVPKIRFCNIDGEGRQGQVVRRRRRGAQSRDGEGRPYSEIDGSSTHYNRRHIRVGSGAGALRQTRSCGRDIRGGSSR